jgi:hypothetical protein
MIKVWFLLILISMPNAPSVKYSGYLYPNEEECMVAKYELMESYNGKSTEYKLTTQMDSFCIEFESFTIKELNKIKGTELGA